MADGLLSKGTKLSIKVPPASTFTELEGLQGVPEIGGTPDKLETTTLDKSSKTYINGLLDNGDLEFTFLYDNSTTTSNYRVLKAAQDAGLTCDFKIEYPDLTAHEFSGQPSVRMAAAEVNAVLTFTTAIALTSDIDVTNPA
jgi:hypothetical protein